MITNKRTEPHVQQSIILCDHMQPRKGVDEEPFVDCIQQLGFWHDFVCCRLIVVCKYIFANLMRLDSYVPVWKRRRKAEYVAWWGKRIQCCGSSVADRRLPDGLLDWLLNNETATVAAKNRKLI